MAVVQQSSVKNSGFKKTIDGASSEIVFDILQRGIYSDPESSVIRESVSNSFDAINERKRALSILNGKSKPEDHFDMEKVGGVYHGSGWDPDYFSPEHLSDDDHVYITHEYGTLSDILSIKDNGVGLGGSRLLGYFKFGYSSKRTQKGALGKWGLGSKVAFSLGVDSYTVVNNYNGKRIEFEVLKGSVNPITPRFGKDGSINDRITLTEEKEEPVLDDEGNPVLEDGVPKKILVPAVKAYQENTTEKNGLELRIKTIKSDRSKFIDAVKRQLGYIPNINFRLLENGVYTSISTIEKIIIKTDDFIITESSYYNKPHILLGASGGYINYGFINFSKLGIDDRLGAIGLILNINDIDVTASRESPEWSKRTLRAIDEAFTKVQNYAETVVNEQVKNETDYVVWLQTVAGIIRKMSALKSVGNSSSANTDRGFMELASIINPQDIRNLTFGTKKFEFDIDFLGPDMTIKLLDGKNRMDISAFTPQELFQYEIYYSETPPNAKIKDKYIVEMLEGGRKIILAYPNKSEDDNDKPDPIHAAKNKAFLDSHKIKRYDKVIIPESYKTTTVLEEKAVTSGEDDMTPAERAQWKKLNEMITISLVMTSGSGASYNIKLKDLSTLAAPIKLDYPSTYTEDTETDYEENPLYGRIKVIYVSQADRYFTASLLQCFGDYFCNQSIRKDRSTQIPYWSAQGYNTGMKTMYKHFGVLEGYAIAVIAKENIKFVEGLDGYISLKEFMVEKYNKKTGHLEFSPVMKYITTKSIINNGFIPKVYGIVESGKSAFNINSNYISDSRNVSRRYFDRLLPKSNLFDNPLNNAIIYQSNKFITVAIRLSLSDYNNPYLAEDLSKEDYQDKLLQLLDDEIPEGLMSLDDINSIDLLDYELLNEAFYFSRILKKIPSHIIRGYYEFTDDLYEGHSESAFFLDFVERYKPDFIAAREEVDLEIGIKTESQQLSLAL